MMHRLRRSLFLKLAGPLALTLLVSFGLATGVTILLGRQSIDRQLADSLRFEATLALSQVQNHIGQRLAEMELWAGDAVMDDVLIDDRELRVQNHLLRLKRAFSREYVQLAVLGRANTVVAATDVRSIGHNLDLNALQLEPVPGSRARRSRAVVTIGDVRAVALTHPITSRLRDDTAGTLIAYVSWRPIEEIVARRSVGPPLHLVDAAGHVIAGHGDTSNSTAVVAAQQPGELVEAYANGRRYVLMAAAPGAADNRLPADWRIVAFRESTAAYWPVRLFILSVVGASLAGLLVSGGTSFVLARTASRRLRFLRDSTRRIASGDLKHRARVLGDDELGDLARSFNRMTHELENAHGGLERLVDERTAALMDRTFALETSEARTRAIIASSLDGIVTFNGEGRIEEFNPAAEAIFGLKGADTVGLFITDLIVPPPLVGADETFMRYLSRNDRMLVGRHFESYGRRPSKGQFPIELALTRTTGVNERPVFTAFIRDISARKRAEQELGQAKVDAELTAQTRSEFMVNMSREIRTKLSGVVGMLELLSGGALTDEQRQSTAVAKSTSDGLLHLVNDVVEFSKVDGGKLALDCVAFDLRALVEEAVEVVAADAHAKSLDLCALVEPDVPAFVMGDPPRVRQVFVAVLSHAVKSTARGEVVVHVRRVEGKVQIEVADSSAGITRDSVARLFRPFSTVDSSMTAPRNGTGLALAISKQIVEAMDGSITVRSEESRGTHFYVTLPLEGHGPAPDQTVPTAAGRRALVAATHAATRSAVVQQMMGLGFEVDEAADPDAFAHHVRHEKPGLYSVIVADAALSLVEPATEDSVPRLILMTQSDETRLREALRPDVDHRIRKPIRRAALRTAVQQAILRQALPRPGGPTAEIGVQGR